MTKNKLKDVLVFVSFKDKSSKFLIKFIKSIPKYEEFVSFIDIEKYHSLVIKNKIKVIPTVKFDNNIYSGNETLSLIKYIFDLEEQENKEQDTNRQLKDYEEDEQIYTYIDEISVPKFKDITENCNSFKVDNLDEALQKYNKIKEEIDNSLSK